MNPQAPRPITKIELIPHRFGHNQWHVLWECGSDQCYFQRAWTDWDGEPEALAHAFAARLAREGCPGDIAFYQEANEWYPHLRGWLIARFPQGCENWVMSLSDDELDRQFTSLWKNPHA